MCISPGSATDPTFVYRRYFGPPVCHRNARPVVTSCKAVFLQRPCNRGTPPRRGRKISRNAKHLTNIHNRFCNCPQRPQTQRASTPDTGGPNAAHPRARLLRAPNGATLTTCTLLRLHWLTADPFASIGGLARPQVFRTFCQRVNELFCYPLYLWVVISTSQS